VYLLLGGLLDHDLEEIVGVEVHEVGHTERDEHGLQARVEAADTYGRKISSQRRINAPPE